ncbi:MAG TPA: hypothetical protein VF476_11110 [Chitinophagaceae bacterium]
MKTILSYSCMLGIMLLMSCGSSDAGKTKEPVSANTEAQSNPAPGSSGSGVVGEWEQQYTYFDKNGNNKLEADEKNPSNTRLGFDWFRFNEDGTCLRDKQMKFKSTYEIQKKGDADELMIHNVHGYTITELTSKELILGAEGTFIVFKRIS